MTNAVLYLRVSQSKETEGEQENSDSIENQRALLSKRLEKEKYTLVGEYVDDGLSGFKKKKPRPGFSAMLADMALGKFDVILVRHADRLERNDGDSSLIRLACAKYGVKWQTHDGQVTDPATASGAFNAKIMSAVSQLESELKSERLLNFYAGAQAKGEVLPPRGTYGYLDDDRTKIVPEEAERIREAYRAVGEKGLSVGSVVRLWNDEGYPQRKGGKRWTYAHLNGILKRPRNAGLVFVDGEELPGVVGQWETIVDPELWRKVNDILSDLSRKTSPGFQPVWLSSGTARCGVCGSSMRSNTATDSRRGTRFSILRCSAVKNGERHASAKLDDLEPLVREAVVEAFLWGGDSLLPKGEGIDVGALVEAQATISEDKAAVMAYRSEGLLSRAEERLQLTALSAKSEALAAQIATARATNSSAHMLVDLRQGFRVGKQISIEVAAKLSTELGERFDALHIEQRRQLVAELLDIVVAPGRGDKYVIVHRRVKGLNSQG